MVVNKSGKKSVKTGAKTSSGTTRKKNVLSYEIGELDHYLLGQGNHYEIYKKLGAHEVTVKGKKGVYFAVWAPHAKSVSVIGDFNGWDEDANCMERQEPLGIYVGFVPGVKAEICISFVSRHRRETVCTRQIHLQIMQN